MGVKTAREWARAHQPTITKPEMTRALEEDMTKIAERRLGEEEVVEESRSMLDSVFDDLLSHQEEIETSLREGLRTDKIVGTCPSCGKELIIRRGRRGSRFIGCTGYPDCTFTLPLPKFGMIIVTDKTCEEHGMYHIRIINKGKRPWDLGCPKCNFDQWQAKKAEEAKKKAEVDALAKIPGIGPKTLEKLEAAGVKTALDLAGAEAEELAEKTGLNKKKLSSWQVAAKSMAEDASGC